MRKMVSVLLVLALASSLVISSAAAETRATKYMPALIFNGTTATCSFSAAEIGKSITASLELWCGNTRIASWSDSATSFLMIDEEIDVTAGQTYTLKVSGSIDGVPFTGTPVTATCPG